MILFIRYMQPFLSVIIPVYNEERRINSLLKILNYLKTKTFTSEVVLVNDGSSDDTVKKIKSIQQKTKKTFPQLKLISYTKNMGKGHAVKEGMMASSGKNRLFLDIDLSTPIEEFDKFEGYLKKFDVIIGSRKASGAKLVKRQPIIRELLGRGFTKLSQIILGVKVSDFTCGFKCFSQKAASEFFSHQRINRWGFDSEILFLAKKLGFKVKEIPVVWKNDSETKVKLPHDIINSLIDLYKIRYNDFKKIYH